MKWAGLTSKCHLHLILRSNSAIHYTQIYDTCDMICNGIVYSQAGLTSKGHLHLILRSNSTGGPMGEDTSFSGGTDVDISIKLSPVSLS